ncbi:hypothetical protein ACFFRR_002960 [Megaselia abdita]
MGVTPSKDFNEETKVWSGQSKKPMYHDDIAIGQILHMRLVTQPKNVLQINDTEGITYTNEEILSFSRKIALSLQEMGLTQQDFVGIMASNTSLAMPVCFGCLFIGTPIHPCDVTFTKEATVYAWRKTKPKVIFCDGSAYKVCKEVSEELKLNCDIFTINDHIEGVKKVHDLFIDRGMKEIFFQPLEVPSGDQTAVILCSSGSTGLSKAVTMSHKNLTRTVGIFMDTDQDVVLTFSSLYWGSGLLGVLNAGITGATHLVISKPFDAESAVELISKYKVTKTMLPPRNIALILNASNLKPDSLKSLKAVNCGGAKLPVEIRQRFKKFVSPTCILFFGYGCTEGGMIAANYMEMKLESTGTVAPNMQVKIIDENGNALGEGEDGEICVKSDVKWNGYFGDQEATDEVYDVESGWYKTGDLGHFDDEGYLYIVDRIKEIMKSKGYHISPSEIEELILELPEVADACVVGIPDVLTVNLPAVLIIKALDKDISEEAIAKYVADKKPHYKHLTGGVYFVDSFPRTASGKILRRKAREVAEKLFAERNGKQ